MKTVFVNPFVSTELDSKVKEVTFKIGNFDYTIREDDVSRMEIDFDSRFIKVNDALDSTGKLRELLRAFFIIVANELELNKEFSNGKKADLDDIAFANLSWNFIH
jgi:hypothetical protein|nr:MAG TPA: hypothetical protein [Crassvirales sp.]